MIYFANPSTEKIRDAVRAGHIGIISTPKSSRESQKVYGAYWCADNGCFGDGFDAGQWWNWLVSESQHAQTCVFATAPDVVGNHWATLDRSAPWLPKIRHLGYKAAFVAQDGATKSNVPWDSFDSLFIGGTTEFKLGETARQLASHAKNIGKWVHMGRVNSAKRFRYAESIGCDSVDGTYLIYGPDTNLPKLMAWIRELHTQPALFTMSGDAS